MFPVKESPRPDDLTAECYQIFKEVLRIFQIIFFKCRRENTSKPLMRSVLLWYQRLAIKLQEKKMTGQYPSWTRNKNPQKDTSKPNSRAP